MKIILLVLLVLSYGCSQVKPLAHPAPVEDDDVSVNAALNQAHASYLLGCVEALKPTSSKPVFPLCRERAIKHRLSIEETLRQIPLPATAPQ